LASSAIARLEAFMLLRNLAVQTLTSCTLECHLAELGGIRHDHDVRLRLLMSMPLTTPRRSKMP
jgi:hypothetical protein